MKTVLITTLIVLLITTGGASGQGISLAQGVEAYWKADYDTAISLLKTLDIGKLSSPEQVLAHKILALSLVAKNQAEEAEMEFTKLLEVEPTFEIDAKEFAPRVLDVFKEAKVVQARKLYEDGLREREAGHLDEAIRHFDLALQLDKKSPLIRDLRDLAVKELGAKREECLPALSWGEMDVKDARCGGIDYSARFRLPSPANRITLIYNKHYFGAGKCWKIVLYDKDDKEIYTLQDPEISSSGREAPGNRERWKVIDLPDVRMVAKIVMYGEGGRSLERRIGSGLSGKDLSDEFLLGLEVACPTGF